MTKGYSMTARCRALPFCVIPDGDLAALQADRTQRLTLPTATEVHVWIARLDIPTGDLARITAATTRAERAQAARFWRREDGDRYLSSHGMLRLILAAYLACDPLSLQFAVGEHGKPALEDGSLDFNLSHSGDVAVVAAAKNRRVGVDVEQLRLPMPGVDDVAGRVCTPDELAILSGLAQPERTHAFLRLWTRKEARAKATGEGIQGVMRGVPLDPSRWHVQELTLPAGYVASVAAEGDGWQVVTRQFKLDG